MEITFTQGKTEKKLTGAFKLTGTKQDLLRMYGCFKEQLTQIDAIPEKEQGTITIRDEAIQKTAILVEDIEDAIYFTGKDGTVVKMPVGG